MGTGVFFIDPDWPWQERKQREDELLQICEQCPVLEACRDFQARTAMPVQDHVIAGMRPKEANQWWWKPENRKIRRYLHRPECGTEVAYTRHLDYGEPVDERCRTGHNIRVYESKARSSAA